MGSLLAVQRLRTDFQVNPIAVDAISPRLTWELSGDGRGRRQTAWQIEAASTADALTRGGADRWRSAEVMSGEQVSAYAGARLGARSEIFWRVRVRDEVGAWSNWSDIASFRVGLLSNQE